MSLAFFAKESMPNVFNVMTIVVQTMDTPMYELLEINNNYFTQMKLAYFLFYVMFISFVIAAFFSELRSIFGVFLKTESTYFSSSQH